MKKINTPRRGTVADDYATIDLNITYGNVHIENNTGMKQLMKDGLLKKKWKSHRWIMFLYLDDGKKELTENIIKSVTYFVQEATVDGMKTHHKIIVRQQPYLLSRPGEHEMWGHLSIKIQVEFRKWAKLTDKFYQHQISFTGDGSKENKSMPIKVPRAHYIQNMMVDKSRVFKTDVQEKW